MTNRRDKSSVKTRFQALEKIAMPNIALLAVPEYSCTVAVISLDMFGNLDITELNLLPVISGVILL